MSGRMGIGSGEEVVGDLLAASDPFYLGPDPEAEAEHRRQELQAAIKAAFEDAISHNDDYLAPPRSRAQDYYDGAVYSGDDVEDMEELAGRSRVVAREVADIIHQMLPGIVRIFTSGERVVEFVAQGPEDEEQAAQQTDYVEYCINADGNSWFSTLHDAVHDALLKKSGVVKWWWQETAQVEEFLFTGLDPIQLQQLLEEPGIELLERTDSAVHVERPADHQPPGAPFPGAAAAAAGPAPSPAEGPGESAGSPGAAAAQPSFIDLPVSDVRVRRRRTRGLLRLAAIPPEEFLIGRRARDLQSATYCAHRTLRTVSEIVADGLAERELVEDLASQEQDIDREGEDRQRNPALGVSAGHLPDKSTWLVLYVEHFLRYDSDDDGIAELHRIVTIGDNCDEILSDEIVDEVPMAVGSPVRQPHSVIGDSVAEQTMDLQDLKTGILRGVMDSLAEALDPRLTVVENAVEMADVLSTERGAIYRQKAPGMIQMLQMPFVGQEALGVLAYVDMVKAQRTGITAASTGLSPEILQSTTKSAADNTIERSQERVEMIARTLSETLVKQVFRGVLRTIVRHQDQPRTVRLRGKWVSVDPRSWNAELDVMVNVALGRGPDSTRMAFLQGIAARQEAILQQYGPGNPLVTIRQLRATYAEICRLAGYRDADRFFLDPSAEDEAKAAQAAAAAKPQDPNVMLAQAEIRKGEIEAQVKVRGQELELWKAQQQDDRERDRLEADIALRAAEIQAKYGAQVNTAAIKADIDRQRYAAQAGIQAGLQARQQDLEHQRELRAQEMATQPPQGGL